MPVKIKHRWVKLYGNGYREWCNLCGTVRHVRFEGWFWNEKKRVTYITPWNHPNGDRNHTVFDTEPECITLTDEQAAIYLKE